MLKSDEVAKRKGLKRKRVAICPEYRCFSTELLKPLKLGIFGRRRYPRCGTHNVPLVFEDEFVEGFFKSVNACLYDTSIVPPNELMESINSQYPEEIQHFFNGWIKCSTTGRGLNMVDGYFKSLSRAYTKSLNEKQQQAIENDSPLKKREQPLIDTFNDIQNEFVSFLRKLSKMQEIL